MRSWSCTEAAPPLLKVKVWFYCCLSRGLFWKAELKIRSGECGGLSTWVHKQKKGQVDQRGGIPLTPRLWLSLTVGIPTMIKHDTITWLNVTLSQITQDELMCYLWHESKQRLNIKITSLRRLHFSPSYQLCCTSAWLCLSSAQSHVDTL